MPDDPKPGDTPVTPPVADPVPPVTPADPPPVVPPVDPAKPVDPPVAPVVPPVVPETYDLKLPDNSALDATAMERTAAFARERGLSNEAAQKALEFVHQEVAAQSDALLKAHQPGGAVWTKQVETWEAQVLADKDIGGSKEQVQKSGDLGKRVLATFFPESTREFLEKTGFGSHPDVLRGLVNIGKAMSEGSFVMPKSADVGSKSTAELLYGSTPAPA